MSAVVGQHPLRIHGDSMVRPGDVDHAVNVLAGGPPTWVLAAIDRALTEGALTRYPDPAAAIEAVAQLHGRRPEEVLITNGAAEALWLIGPALEPERAAILQPGFTETEAGLRAHQVRVDRVSEAEAIRPEHDLVVATNPTSPDGRLRRRAELMALSAPGRTVVVDEAFMSMVPGERESLAGDAPANVVVIRSLTKLLAVPGLRVGYVLAAAPVIAALRSVCPPWSANALALAVLARVAEHRHELTERALLAANEREDLIAALRAVPGVLVHPSETNFVLIEVPGGARLVTALRDRGIAVRPADSFPGFGPDHIRITARDPAANARLAVAIAESLESL